MPPTRSYPIIWRAIGPAAGCWSRVARTRHEGERGHHEGRKPEASLRPGRASDQRLAAFLSLLWRTRRFRIEFWAPNHEHTRPPSGVSHRSPSRTMSGAETTRAQTQSAGRPGALTRSPEHLHRYGMLHSTLQGKRPTLIERGQHQIRDIRDPKDCPA